MLGCSKGVSLHMDTIRMFWNGEIPAVPSRRRRTVCRLKSLEQSEKAFGIWRPEPEYKRGSKLTDSWGRSVCLLRHREANRVPPVFETSPSGDVFLLEVWL